MVKRKEKKQTFRYRGKEYKYRINSASLLKMEYENRKRAEEILRMTEGKMIILYYCTCWKGEGVTKEQFLRDCKNQMVSFRPGAGEYNSIELYKLLSHKIREYKRNGDL